ncbi:MAG: YwaF family protein [Erysipelotrichaceae bacterium]|nr:YwaF family protein [Erysipelotrichaceae bacterium]
MNLLERLLILLDANMNQPVSYGWFHWLFLILTIITLMIVFFRCRNLDNRQIKRILLTYAIITLSLEVYKQINFSFNYDAVSTWWSYQWYAFPFQFCSTPMYIALIGALTKNKTIEKACYAFLATFGLTAGLAVMLYPATVFVDTIGINFQTMIHHSTMIIIGFLLIANQKVIHDRKTLILAFNVFIICVAIAISIDVSTYFIGINNGLEMFFISPYHDSSLPIFNIIYQQVPYLLFLIIYIATFALGSYMLFRIFHLPLKTSKSLHSKTTKSTLSHNP